MSDQVAGKKSKHIASSARIFATGLTATAVLGLTSTLALAKPSWSDSSAATSPDTTVAALLATAPVAPDAMPTQSNGQAISQSVATPTAPPPAPSAPAPAVPVTTVPATNTPANNNQSPVVVNVPVPVPPSNGNNTSAPTQSNGS